MSRSALRRDLDVAQFVTLSALADIEEEAGDHALSAAYRWLAEKRKWPFAVDGWYRWARAIYPWQFGASNFLHPHIILTIDRRRKLMIGLPPGHFREPSEAIVAAAEAITDCWRDGIDIDRPETP